MATKKAASKKASETESAPVKTAAKKTAAKKTPAPKSPARKAETAAAPPEHASKPKPSHHDVSVQAYLLWERDGKKHGHHDQYWHKAEQELNK